MHKLQEENAKLKSRYNRLRSRYYKLQHEVDEEISNKLSLFSIKVGAIFMFAFAIGRITT